MKKLFVAILILATALPAFAKAKKVHTAQNAMMAMAWQHNEQSVINLLKSKMTKSDGQYVTQLMKDLKVDLSKPLKMKISKNAVQIAGMPSAMQIRLNGKEITYQNTVFKLNKADSFQANVANFAKKLNQKTAASSLFFSEAHAEASYEHSLTDFSASQVAKSLKYIGEHIEDQEFRDSATLESDPELSGVFNNMHEVKSVECNQGSDTSFGENVYMYITFKNGNKSTLKAIAPKEGAADRNYKVTMDTSVDNMGIFDQEVSPARAELLSEAIYHGCQSKMSGESRKKFETLQNEETGTAQ